MSLLDHLSVNYREALVRALDDVEAKDGARISYGWNPNAGWMVPRAMNGEAIEARCVVGGVTLWSCAILSPIGYALAKELRDGKEAA